jgi:hypothetical protein
MAGTRWVLRVTAALGLAVQGVVHWRLAPGLDTLVGSGSPRITMGELFRVEAVIALVALLLLIGFGTTWTAALAALVAAGGLAAVLLYAFVTVGAVGPLPNMDDPTWPAEKLLSAVAEGVAALAALGYLAAIRRQLAARTG